MNKKSNKSNILLTKSDVSRGLRNGLKESNCSLNRFRIDTGSSIEQGASDSAEVAAVMSVCKHVYAYYKNEENINVLLKEVGKDTGMAAAKGAVIAGGAELIKTSISRSSADMLVGLGGTAFPVIAATVAFEIGNSMRKLFTGQISASECLEEIKGKSISIIGASIGATIGSAIAGPILGGMIGSMVGNVVATFTYQLINDISTIDSQVNCAHENRIKVEKQCAELKDQIEESRMKLEQMAKQYINEYSQTFRLALNLMDEAIFTDNIDEFLLANNLIISQCGGEIQFRNMKEFDDIMNSNLILKF